MFQKRHMLEPLPRDRINPLVLSDRECQGYSLLRGLDAARAGNWLNAGFEREVSIEIAKRAGTYEPDRHSLHPPPQILAPQRRDLTVASAPGGGYLVGTEIVGAIDALRELLRVKRLGAQTLTGLRANATYVKQGTKSTVTWLPTESTQATETADFSFSQIALSPKQLTCHTEVSRNLRLMAPELAEFTLRREFALSMATSAEVAAIAGTGASGQPLGLLSTPGIGTFSGTSLAYAGVLEAQTDILNANAVSDDAGQVGYLCRPTVASLLATRQAFSTLESMWVGPLAAGKLIGCPAYSTNSAPAATLIAGDWSQLLIAEWGALEIRVNPYANFPAGITGFAANLSMNIAVLQPAAFSVATSIT